MRTPLNVPSFFGLVLASFGPSLGPGQMDTLGVD